MYCPTDRSELLATPLHGVSVERCSLCSGCFLRPDSLVTLARTIANGGALTLEQRGEKPSTHQCPSCQGALIFAGYREIPTSSMEFCTKCQGVWMHQDRITQLVTANQEKPLIQGRFALGEEMLTCRFSTLYHAMDRSTGTPVVVRKLHEMAAQGGDREARLQMLREGNILQRLNHRNIPRVLEIIEDADDQVYLILEDFGGVTLERFLSELGEPGGPLLLRRFLEQFLSVLKYLHNQDPPIVNRDLRPDTVMLTPHGVIKIADFSMARLRESAADAKHTVYKAMGSPIYAAPEQLAGGSTMPGNDIYSVGAILYFLGTQSNPPESLLLFNKAATVTSMKEQRPDVPNELHVIIAALMEPDPKIRPKTVEAVEKMLLDLSPAPRKISRPTLLRMQAQQAGGIATPTGGGGIATPTGGAPAGTAVAEPPRDDIRRPTEPQPEVAAEPNGRAATAEAAPDNRAFENAEMPAAGYKAPVKVVDSGPAKKKSIWGGGFFAGKKKKDGPQVIVAAGPTEEDLAKFEFVDLSKLELDRTVARILPETVSKSIQGVVIGQRSATQLTVVVKDPTQVYIYDHVSFATQGRYSAFLLRGDQMMIELCQEYIYRIASIYEKLPFLEWLERKKFQAETLDVKSASKDIAFGADDITSPIIASCDRLIKEAISIGASDIHMESFEEEMVVRYRIDGVLHEIQCFEAKEAGAMVKRVKIMANMDIAQDRITQGGRISVSVAGREIDLRVSIVPVPAGESVVMRLLKKGAFNLKLGDLGFSPRDEKRYQVVLNQPHGMILVSGPTGSGKSTTLYASLKEIQRPDRKLLTVEDPIEYQMPRICQVQVNLTPQEETKRVTFARTLREFLRQDPDVILVGEVRDPETAAISVQAALTGHLLLSTIHTNDSIGIFARLRDMGVEPYLIGSTMVGGVAQRLCRKICPDCKEEIPVPEAYKATFAKEEIDIKTMFRGRGENCQPCHGTGYRGRLAVYEILELTPDLRELVARNAHNDEIEACARPHGFRTLWQDGLDKVSHGVLTIDEVERVCMTL